MTQKRPSGKNWKVIDQRDPTGLHRKVRVLRVKTRLTHGGPDRHVLLLTSGMDTDRFLSYLATGSVSKGERDITHIARQMGIDLFVVSEMQRGYLLQDRLLRPALVMVAKAPAAPAAE